MATVLVLLWGLFCAFNGEDFYYVNVLMVLLTLSFSVVSIRTRFYPVAKNLLWVYILHVAVADVVSGVEICCGIGKGNYWWLIIPESAIVFALSLITTECIEKAFGWCGLLNWGLKHNVV